MKQLQFEASALAKNLSQIRHFVESAVEGLGFDESQGYHIVLAVDEVCSNVVRYAYPDRESEKNKISLKINIYENKIKIKIRDYGIKYDPSAICGREIDDIKPGGLGLHLIHGCMNKVFFNPEIKEGNELILIKYLNK